STGWRKTAMKHLCPPRRASGTSVPAGPGRLLALLALPLLVSCGVTSRMEPYKQTDAVISDGEQIVILARKHHANREAEQEFIDCIGDSLSKGRTGLEVHSSTAFEDKMYPWFEPSMAPL